MIGDKIKNARIDNRLMQKDLAKMLNVGPSTVSMWEAGTRTPDLQMVAKISKLLNISLEDLLEDKLLGIVVDNDNAPENIKIPIKEKAPDISRSDLETILNQMDESEIDQMIDYAQYLLSKKAIRFVPEDQSSK
ncbi:MAG: helix-turn-helix transcriptional regulator [Oscillospiraceae bacterium]|nr:helix-turn-helix transcriptional regulator [Oscillospiraceae bacterium]MBP0988798.1 helix-turn-helix transcriptional regulator [Oscillospiraceae bacterium]